MTMMRMMVMTLVMTMMRIIMMMMVMMVTMMMGSHKQNCVGLNAVDETIACHVHDLGRRHWFAERDKFVAGWISIQFGCQKKLAIQLRRASLLLGQGNTESNRTVIFTVYSSEMRRSVIWIVFSNGWKQLLLTWGWVHHAREKPCLYNCVHAFMLA